MNSFDYNFMKLAHIINHNVFKFQNGPYRIMPSGVIALCLWPFPIYAYFAIAGASVSQGHISSFFLLNQAHEVFQYIQIDAFIECLVSQNM